jgi:hypothetical protein
MGSMARPAPDPLAGATHLLVDGTNLLHALARRGGPLPPAAVVGRLRAFVPPGVAVTVVLDGSPAPGGRERRLASGIEVRYSGRRTADALLGDLVAASPAGRLVVTDDGALAASLRAAGARTARTAWLAERLSHQRLEAPAAGRPKPPPGPPAGHPGGADEETGPRWKPGRGATKKTGNPKRGRPSSRG